MKREAVVAGLASEGLALVSGSTGAAGRLFVCFISPSGFCYADTQLATQLPQFLFLFLFCNAATQLATRLPQRRIQVVRSNKVARKRLTESNGRDAYKWFFLFLFIKSKQHARPSGKWDSINNFFFSSTLRQSCEGTLGL